MAMQRWLVEMVSGKCESIDIALASGRCDGNLYARWLVVNVESWT
jgi:hypothetical protein